MFNSWSNCINLSLSCLLLRSRFLECKWAIWRDWDGQKLPSGYQSQCILSLLPWSCPVQHESLPKVPKDNLILILSKSAWRVILKVYKYILLFKRDKILLLIIKGKSLPQRFQFKLLGSGFNISHRGMWESELFQSALSFFFHTAEN